MIPIDAPEMQQAIKDLAESVSSWRKDHSGMVPLAVFPYCMSIGGSYPCIQLIVRTEEANTFLLKKREVADQGWTGMYQVPGVIVRSHDNWEKIFARLSEEVFEKRMLKVEECTLLGSKLHFVEERGAMCQSTIFQISLPQSMMASLSGLWRSVDMANPDSLLLDIIPDHVEMIRWAIAGSSPVLFVP